MQIVLLRHAQPQWTTPEGKGNSNPGLTPEGIKRSEALSQTLGAEPFDSIQVSPYKRSQETARLAFAHRNSELRTAEWLREIRLPDFSQRPVDQIIDFFSNARARPLAKWWDGPPGGESFRDFHLRIENGLQSFLASLGIHRMRPDDEHDKHLFEIPEERRQERHLIVSHLGTTGVILSHLLHLEMVPWVLESFCLDWNGVVRLETVSVADGCLFCLRVFNEGGHRDPTLGGGKSRE